MRWAIVIGCVVASAAAGCSSATPGNAPRTSATAPSASQSEPSISQDSSIPGLGATRAAWNDSHSPNAADPYGSAYGDDPSLPTYLAPGGAVFSDLGDLGTDRIQFYDLNMHTVDFIEALRQVRLQLPSDARVAWDLPLDQCHRLAFSSTTLEAAGQYMADVQLEYIEEDGTRQTSPDRYNKASLWLNEAGSPPDPEKGCG